MFKEIVPFKKKQKKQNNYKQLIRPSPVRDFTKKNKKKIKIKQNDTTMSFQSLTTTRVLRLAWAEALSEKRDVKMCAGAMQRLCYCVARFCAETRNETQTRIRNDYNKKQIDNKTRVGPPYSPLQGREGFLISIEQFYAHEKNKIKSVWVPQRDIRLWLVIAEAVLLNCLATQKRWKRGRDRAGFFWSNWRSGMWSSAASCEAPIRTT